MVAVKNFGDLKKGSDIYRYRFSFTGRRSPLPRVKTQLTMLRFNGLVNRIGGPTDAGELVLV
jgi:hypothetical protein